VTRNTNTVSHHLSEADIVLPLLAGWEKTESTEFSTLWRSSHEAYHPARLGPFCPRSLRRGLALGSVVLEINGTVSSNSSEKRQVACER
jgi:hypothetical protein